MMFKAIRTATHNHISPKGDNFCFASIFNQWLGRRRNAKQRFDKVSAICRADRGIFKRIDENRELLELLQHESPELLKRCFWIESWMESQDLFLIELAKAVGTKNLAAPGFPRPWPGSATQEESLTEI